LLVTALLLALGLAGAGASSASAAATFHVKFSCTGVTYFFEGFPNANNNTVKEAVFSDGAFIAKEKFIFNGPSGSNTVAISLAPGHHSIDARASWNTNGVKGSKDLPRGGGITCPAEPAFTIEKLQKIFGNDESFTKEELTGEAGETVEYEIIVKNTGNTSLTFSNFKDANCEAIGGGPSGPLAHGESATYTCEHLITIADKLAGSHENNANVTGTPPDGQVYSITHTSNTVVVKVPTTAKPSFTIEKLQRLEGEAGYTQTQLTGKLGQTVEYEVVVKNTGNTSLKFSELSDANCEGISPSGEVELAAGGEQVYTCSHVLTQLGEYTNEASITGNEGTGTETSNKVVVNVPAEPAFTIEKLQRIEGKEPFTKAELTATLGQTVEYEVIVKNTGNTSLTFSNFMDGNCEGISPSGEVTLPPGGEQMYTCHHKLMAVGLYENNATITGTPPEGQGGPITHSSNTVVVKVEAAPVCTKATIESNFNGTAIPEGDWIWFNSVLKPSGTSSGGTIKFTNQKITIVKQNKEVVTLSVPNATITFSTGAKEGTTTFSGGEWVTTVPAKFTDNVFLAGLAYQLPATLEGGANPVSWEGDFTTSSPTISLQWQWAAAAYTLFTNEYNSLDVKPLHSTTEDAYHNGDQAGTPENTEYQKHVTGGARGGGGCNYTGSYTGTGRCP